MAVHCVWRKYTYIISFLTYKRKIVHFVFLPLYPLPFPDALTQFYRGKVIDYYRYSNCWRENKYFVQHFPVQWKCTLNFNLYSPQCNIAKGNLNFKHCKDKKNKIISIWEILQKYLIYNLKCTWVCSCLSVISAFK